MYTPLTPTFIYSKIKINIATISSYNLFIAWANPSNQKLTPLAVYQNIRINTQFYFRINILYNETDHSSLSGIMNIIDKFLN